MLEGTEAKFLRALMYFNLVRYFGAVPLVMQEIIEVNGHDRKTVRDERGAIIDFRFGLFNNTAKRYMGASGEDTHDRQNPD
jgi:hypothetical protein